MSSSMAAADAESFTQELKFYVIHTFSDNPKAGNPVAVCFLSYEELTQESEKLQEIANELGYSETAFFRPINSEVSEDSSTATTLPTSQCFFASVFRVRFFTPVQELEFGGHGTLATAYVIFNVFCNQQEKIVLISSGGSTVCRKDNTRIIMELKQYSYTELEAAGQLKVTHGVFNAGHGIIMLELDHSSTNRVYLLCSYANFMVALESLKPNTVELCRKCPLSPMRSLIVTIAGSDCQDDIDPQNVALSFDFFSRCFSPWIGIPENPVTASAHCLLGPYWASKLHKNLLFAQQCSSRVGELCLELKDSGQIEISGKCLVKELRTLFYPRIFEKSIVYFEKQTLQNGLQ